MNYTHFSKIGGYKLQAKFNHNRDQHCTSVAKKYTSAVAVQRTMQGTMDSKLSLVDAAAQALHISVEVLPPDLTIKAEVRVS